jgi:hypothetical protein
LNQADAIYVGSKLAAKIYRGSVQVWPSVAGVNIVTDYGADGSAQWVTTTLDIAIGTTTLTTSDPIWSPADAGKAVVMPPLPFGSVFLTTIATYVSSTQVILAAPAPVAYAAYEAIIAWGPDSTAAFQSFKDDYQGLIATLYIPPGVYLISSGNFGGMWDGIANITVNATGATLAGGLFQVQASAQYEAANHMAYTATVAAGATSVTLLTPAQTSRFAVGGWAMMSGLDMQMYGYPTNHARFEYLKIASIDAGTGVITFTTPLVDSYKSTWPVYNTSGANFGGPATLYAMDPRFEHTSVVNGLTIAQFAQYGVSGLDLTFNDCTFAGTGQLGPHPTMAKRVVFNDCVATGTTLEIDKLVTLLEVNGGTWRVLNYQSANSIRETILDNVIVTASIVGSPWKFIIRNGCDIAYYQCATVFFGYANELIVSDSTIHLWSSGAVGTSHRTLDGGTQDGIDQDATMVGGVITVPAAMRAISISQWGIEGGRLFFVDTAVGNIASFTITDVTESAPGGDILVHTDWSGNGGDYPDRDFGALGVWLQTHPAPICSFDNVTGCAEVVDLSRAPAGLPMWSYTSRDYDGSLFGVGAYVAIIGRVVRIKVTVTTPYTGTAPTLTATVFPGWANDLEGAGQTNIQFTINLKVAGVRELDASAGSYPVSWTGGQTGDTLPSPGLSAAKWIAGNFNVNQSVADIRGESPAVWPLFTVECETDQGFAP